MKVYDEPPLKNRERLQSISTDRLSDRLMRGSNIGCLQLVFICHLIGSKPYLGLHNSTCLYQDDEINNK